MVKKRTLSNKEKRELNERILPLGIEVGKKDIIKVLDSVPSLVIRDNEPILFCVDGEYYPVLKLALKETLSLKKVIIDMGAVPHIAAGADVMRPGITSFDETIQKNDEVLILDLKNGKAIAVGKALFDAAEIKAMTSGKAIKNLHYVGDAIWKS